MNFEGSEADFADRLAAGQGGSIDINSLHEMPRQVGTGLGVPRNFNSLHEIPRQVGTGLGVPRNLDSLHEIPRQGSSYPSLHGIPVIPLPLKEDNVRPLQHIFERTPLKVVRGMKQYLYDEDNNEYLDCVNGTAHVGHCHPQVVGAGQNQMAKLSTAQGFVTDVLNNYIKELVSSLPEPLNVCYLTNSGSEANDLALRLASSYTGQRDVVSFMDGYFGNLSGLIGLSNKIHDKIPGYEVPDWVHLMPLPDTYRRKGPQDWEDYSSVFEDRVRELDSSGRRISALLLEPMFVVSGVHMPPPSFYKSIFKTIRSRGGLVIADEVQTALGRTGEYMWGFMHHEVVPDIVTVGKPLGNGHPMGAVICSPEISRTLGAYFSTFGGNPVSCAIGLSVLEVIKNEKLMSSAQMVGKYLKEELIKLKERYSIVGDCRGLGLCQALEIVGSKSRKIPSPKLAKEIMYGLKGRNVLVALAGRHVNIILITPPMCFNIENSRRLVKHLDEVLKSVERKRENESGIMARQSLEQPVYRKSLKRAFIGGEGEAAEADVADSKQQRSDSDNSTGAGYEDMD